MVCVKLSIKTGDKGYSIPCSFQEVGRVFRAYVLAARYPIMTTELLSGYSKRGLTPFRAKFAEFLAANGG